MIGPWIFGRHSSTTTKSRRDGLAASDLDQAKENSPTGCLGLRAGAWLSKPAPTGGTDRAWRCTPWHHTERTPRRRVRPARSAPWRHMSACLAACVARASHASAAWRLAAAAWLAGASPVFRQPRVAQRATRAPPARRSTSARGGVSPSAARSPRLGTVLPGLCQHGSEAGLAHGLAHRSHWQQAAVPGAAHH